MKNTLFSSWDKNYDKIRSLVLKEVISLNENHFSRIEDAIDLKGKIYEYIKKVLSSVNKLGENNYEFKDELIGHYERIKNEVFPYMVDLNEIIRSLKKIEDMPILKEVNELKIITNDVTIAIERLNIISKRLNEIFEFKPINENVDDNRIRLF